MVSQDTSTAQDFAVDSGRPELPSLTGRQQSELDYHRAHAATRLDLIDEPVSGDILTAPSRRPWNAYWSLYDRIIAAAPAGKRVLVPGSGFGDDAIRLAMLGAHVSAFDLSPESVAIAGARAARAGHCDIDFKVMPAEALAAYADDTFDMAVFADILHHVDIAPTVREIVRVLKPGGTIVGDELYTHSALQRIREAAPVTKIAYPLLQRWIYDSRTPYITPEEHKIDEHELAIVLATMNVPSVEFFGIAEGRLYPSRMVWASRIDRSLIRLSRAAARRLGSRVVFSGKTPG